VIIRIIAFLLVFALTVSCTSSGQKGSKPESTYDGLVVRGALGNKAVADTIAVDMNRIHGCYSLAGIELAQLEGVVTVTWTIGADGLVEQTDIKQSDINNFEVEACIVREISKLLFPEPKDGKPVEVMLPIRFDLDKPAR